MRVVVQHPGHDVLLGLAAVAEAFTLGIVIVGHVEAVKARTKVGK
jgi:hypothetical protein